MKYILLPFAVLVHMLMRYCEWGSKFFGELNDRYLDYYQSKLIK